MAGFAGAREIRIFVGESERGVPHFVDGYFGGATRQREGATPAAAVDCRVHHHQ